MDKNQEKEYLLSLARSLMFDFPGEEADWIVKEFETIRKQLAVLDEVDTEGVEEATWPFEDETTYLRKDEVTDVLTQEEALMNAKEVLAGHIVIPRVVK
ncbi:MAG: Asp-tRNA(Asn)/Glu-tRNA(Gln) amidotransferase subunit GatC [Solobacterium sp.]|nr:Asp-tRNA(Asn)/Glu-tRNA(Gln) amidotransferase subunit GatC [Solobacterium sp.]MBQ6356133.1 Asp-tRNA(Asn)/Glu-tRNA(Gln) amidotransferase subunit GatC [Solobacterium sp.]MBQ6533069.1 Asp-tRNA(Asn)/Glu-tRNA(Gln) amidotransferase subunit GatC [Solobacterium sp.]